MFHSSRKRVRAWLGLDETLVADEPAAPAPHPHRQPLRSRRIRRGGSVMPRPAVCISPVRSRAGERSRDRAAR